MQDFEPIDVDFVINSEEAKKRAKETKEAIEGVGLTAEKAAEQVSDSIQENFYELENSVKQSSTTVTKEVKKQGDVLEGMTGRVKRVAADAVDSFELLDPALRKNLQNIILLENQLESLSSAERQLRDGLKSGTITQGQYNKALAAIRAEAARAQNSLAALAKEARAGISKMSNAGANAPVDNTLDAQANKLRAVSEQYRGVLQAGLEAYSKLDPAAQKLLTQLIGMEDEIRTVSLAQRDLSQRFEEGAVDARTYAEAMAGLNVRESELRNEIRSTSAELQKQSGVMAAQRPQWNGLQNSINQVARELPAFTYSAQTGFMAISNNIPILVDELNRLKVSNQELSKSGQKGVPVWKQVLGGLLSWQTALMVGVTLLTVYGKEIGNFFSSIFRGKSALDEAKKSAELLNKAFDQTSFKKAVKDVNDLRINIDLAKKGMVDASDVVDQYNATVGKAAGQVNNLKDAEQRLIDNADSYVQMMFYKSAAALASDEVAEKLYQTAKRRFELEEELAKAEVDLIEQQNRGVQSGLVSNVQSAEMRVRSLQTMLESLASDSQQDVDKLNKLFSSLNETAAGFGLDTFLNQGGSAAENTLAKLKQDLQELAKKREDILITDTAALDANEKAQIELQEKITALEIKAIQQKAKSAEQILNERQKLTDQLTELDKEYARKSFTKDEEEVQALRDKFAKMRQEIERFNAENPASKIDLSGMNELEVKAVEDLTYRQQTNKLKEELDKQKDLYEEYEEYKKQFGIQAAKEQFAGQIGEFDSYLDYVKSKIDENQDAFNAVGSGTATGGQKERAKFLQGETDSETRAMAERFRDMLSQLQSYHQRREKIISDHAALTKELIAKGYHSEAKEADKLFEKSLRDLNDVAAKDLSGFTDFFNDVDNMSRKAAKEGVDVLIRELQRLANLKPEEGGISKEFFNDMLDKLTTIKQNVKNEIPQALSSWSSELRDIAGSIGTANKGFAQMLNTASDLLARTAQVKANIDAFKAAQDANGGEGDVLGMVSAGLGVAGSAVGGIMTVVNLFKSASEKQIALQKEALALQKQIYYGELELSKVKRERALEEAKIGQTTLKGLEAQKRVIDESFKGVEDGIDEISKKFNKSFENLTVAEMLSVEFEDALSEMLYYTGKTITVKTGPFNLGRKEVQEMKTLAGLSFENIEELSISGKLTDEAEAVFQKLKQLKEEGQELDETLKEIQEELNNIFTGGMEWSGLADGMIAEFQGAGSQVEDILQKAILNGFKYRFLEEPLQKLIDQFAEDAQSGDALTTAEIDKFQKAYAALSQSAQEALKQLEQSTGINLSGDQPEAQKPTGLPGAIRREMTEETASELAGITRGQYDLIKRGLHLNEQRYALEQKNYASVIAIMQSNALIERNTALTVEELRLVVAELKGINRNTKAGQSDRDLGIGP